MNKTYYFISDVHLGLQSKVEETQKESLLVKFLYSIRDVADELFIVGDLYDYWFEYNRVYQKGFYKTLTALKELSESGVKLHYFIGNHDFMHRNFFKDEFNANIYENELSTTINGKKFFIHHGDGLVKNDLGYNILKKILRNKFLQSLYYTIHPDLGIKIASGTSKKSRSYTAKKDYGEEDGLFDSAKKIIEQGYDFVLFGHLHKRQYLYYKNGIYINLGSWLDKPCYGVFRNNNFEIVDWK